MAIHLILYHVYHQHLTEIGMKVEITISYSLFQCLFTTYAIQVYYITIVNHRTWYFPNNISLQQRSSCKKLNMYPFVHTKKLAQYAFLPIFFPFGCSGWGGWTTYPPCNFTLADLGGVCRARPLRVQILSFQHKNVRNVTASGTHILLQGPHPLWEILDPEKSELL